MCWLSLSNSESALHTIVLPERAILLKLVSLTGIWTSPTILIELHCCRTGNLTMINVSVTDANPSLKVFTVFTNVLKPYPKEITQLQHQFVLYEDNAYFTSPYDTKSQTTTIKLPSSSVSSYSNYKGLEPFSLKGSVLTYGPYKDVQGFSVSCERCFSCFCNTSLTRKCLLLSTL